MEVALAVGLAVRRARYQRGCSQEELAELADVDRTYISGLERGLRNPALSTLRRLAEALDLRLSRLFLTAEQIASGRLRVPATSSRSQGAGSRHSVRR
jgi:transcriptional regulator with XRE-family HTH domain